MTKDSIFIVFCGLALLAAVGILIAMRSHYRNIIREKNSGIVSRIRESDRLEKELEQTRIEKELLEKLLISIKN